MMLVICCYGCYSHQAYLNHLTQSLYPVVFITATNTTFTITSITTSFKKIIYLLLLYVHLLLTL